MKKGISTVIATSIIILITVAAVAILWAAVMPIIRNSAPGTDVCMGVTANTDIISACKSGTDLKIVVKQTSDATVNGVKVYPYDADGSPITAKDAGALIKNIEQPFTIANASSAKTVAVAPVVGEKICDSTAKKTVVSNC